MQILLGHCLLLLFFVLSTPFPKRFLLCISNCPQPFLYHDNITDCGLTTELRRCADVPPFVFGCVFLCIPDNSNSVSCSCGACMLVPERGNYPFTDAMVQPCTWTGTITQYMMYGAFSFFWFRRRLSNVDVTFSPLRPIILLSSSFFVSPPLRGKKYHHWHCIGHQHDDNHADYSTTNRQKSWAVRWLAGQPPRWHKLVCHVLKRLGKSTFMDRGRAGKCPFMDRQKRLTNHSWMVKTGL